MDKEIERKKSFLVFLAMLVVVSFMTLSGVLYGIAWGSVCAFLWHPVDRRLGRLPILRRWRGLRVMSSLILFVICITMPVFYMLSSLGGELVSVFDSVSSYVSSIERDGLPGLTKYLPDWISDRIVPFVLDRDRVIGIAASAAQSAGSLIRSISQGLLLSTSAFLFHAFIALVTMFFMLRDGVLVVDYIRDLIPMSPKRRESFVARTAVVMKAVAHGTILTVAVQSMLGGIGWYASGLPNAFLAAGAMFVIGMFPMGTIAVWLPGSIYLMATGAVWNGIGLFVWGACAVSMIDNFLRPYFAGASGNIPTLALILGLSGGIAAWGVLGIFLGPLALALCISALDMYREESAGQSMK